MAARAPEYPYPTPAETSFAPVGTPAYPAYDPNVSGGRLVNEGGFVSGIEHVRVRVPTRGQVKTVYVPGPVVNQVVQGPAREVVHKVRVQAPDQIQKVQVQGPGREVVRKIAVQGPDRVVTRQVQVQGPPREVIRREAVPGPPREVIKRIEVQGPPREVVKRIEVAGPPREEIQTVQIPIPGPAREVVRKVAVPRDVVRQVVKHVDVDQWVDQPVAVQGPGHVKIKFVVDQPPQVVPAPQPVFRTALVPQVFMVPVTQCGVAQVPRTVQPPPRVMDGPTVLAPPPPHGMGHAPGSPGSGMHLPDLAQPTILHGPPAGFHQPPGSF